MRERFLLPDERFLLPDLAMSQVFWKMFGYDSDTCKHIYTV